MAEQPPESTRREFFLSTFRPRKPTTGPDTTRTTSSQISRRKVALGLGIILGLAAATLTGDTSKFQRLKNMLLGIDTYNPLANYNIPDVKSPFYEDNILRL